MTAVKTLTVAAAMGCGALFAVGSLVAALFERDGFGDRDGEPSTAYLLGLAVCFAVSLGLPLVLWRLLLPARFSWPLSVGVAAVAVAGVVSVMGIALTT